MANITLLHWNLETYGPQKYYDPNNTNFVNYVATLINHVNADIFSIVEVKNSVAAAVANAIANAAFALTGVMGFNPWRSAVTNSNYNNEAYIVLYRIDRSFFPYNSTTNTAGINVIPDHGTTDRNAANKRIKFPSRLTDNGGRQPGYITFQTTDTNNIFSVISYHAMFGYYTPSGVDRLPQINYITQCNDAAHTPIVGSLISGDFNVDYNLNHAWYTNVLALPSVNATAAMTSLKDNPGNSDDPSTFMANAYDNIFQKIPLGGATNPGTVPNLMVESAVVPFPQPALPAAQPGAGYLSGQAAAFNVAAINNYLRHITNNVAAVPPTDMNTAWDFVRETISNHYPVVVTTTI
jgi:hypothetical protein